MDGASQHPWDVSPAEARQIQAALAGRVVLEDALSLDDIRTVAGIDNAYAGRGRDAIAHAAVVVLAFPALTPIATATASRPVSFPYVPGLLSFREIPAIIDAYARLDVTPDALLCDGQGYAHPRRFGLACHVGVLLDRPTIGCAKSRLLGTFEEPARVFGADTPLIDQGETIGAAVRTRPSHAPLFVSPGDKFSVEGAVALALACCRNGQFMPVPTRLAHETATALAHPERA
ncbi:MAG TPA: endonuclease V [Thermomicrobiales bacterium]|nr:endonuclease V [Thermomicrobiales bacterium]